MATRLTGWDAIAFAEKHGGVLRKRADGSDAAGRVSVDEARRIAASQPDRVYVDFDEGGGNVGLA